MNDRPLELAGIPGQIAVQGPGEVTFGELVPVEGATAEIVVAYLPSCAAYWETLNFHLDFRNTSSVPVSIRPVLYLGDWDHAFDGVELGPGQSYVDLKGKTWLAGIYVYGVFEFERVEMAIEVYTPEGWVEVDRVAGEPFEWTASIPVPEATITLATTNLVPPGQSVHIGFKIWNPGYTNPPSSGYKMDGEEGWMGRETHPPDTYCSRGFSFKMGDRDRTIILTPYRIAAPCTAAGCTELYGSPVSVTIKSTEEVAMYTETRIDTPDSAREGDVVNATIGVTNLTAAALTIKVAGTLEPGDILYIGYETRLIEPGATEYFSGTFTMPSYDVTIHAKSYFQSTLDSEDVSVVSLTTGPAPAGCAPAAGILLVALIMALLLLL